MKKILKISVLGMFLLTSKIGISQTTAMQLAGEDCNGNQIDVFNDLDNGKAVVLFFYMPNCGSCPPPASKIQKMAQNVNAIYPDAVKGYAMPYNNNTACTGVADWVKNNNLKWYAPVDSGATQVAYYGGFGMPTVVLLGGANRDVLFVTQDFNTSDTTKMRNLILGMHTSAGVKELNNVVSNIEVFPNPSSEIITLKYTSIKDVNSQISVLTTDGKQVQVFEKEKNSVGLNTKQINVKDYPVGNYLIKIEIDGKFTTHAINVFH